MGHVGLPTCVSLARIGHRVVGVDTDPEKISVLTGGTAPFFEPGLQSMLAEELDAGHLSFSTDAADAVPGADIVFICVGTPARATGEANLIAVEQAAISVVKHSRGPAVIVEKSTVPAGTAQRVRRTLEREMPHSHHQLEVASNPEFLREGRAMDDSINPDRILVGAESETAFATIRRLYKPLIDKGARLIETDIATAELAKHACNAFLATKISFINAVARMCERAGGDVVKVAEVMGADSRIGPEFLRAGMGYGGYCFPKDLQAFERHASRLGYEFGLLREVANINDEAVRATEDKVRDALWNLEGKRVALLGLAFKPYTDDTRLSPSLALARLLLDEGAEVIGYDPHAAANAKSEIPELEIAPDPYEACRGAHCLVLGTDWEEFRSLDVERLREELAYPVIVDGRNLLDPEEVAAHGFSYYPSGRPGIH
jgi:UDPglucose 6-dehydrogenase